MEILGLSWYWFLIIILVILILWGIIVDIRKPSGHCIECERKTKNTDKDGSFLCLKCKPKVEERQELKAIEEKEGLRYCPVDNVLMKKEKVKDAKIFIDRCPQCNGIWLDANELVKISKTNSQESEDGDSVAAVALISYLSLL